MADTNNMKARVGRDHQRYNERGERFVAGIVPLNADKSKVLLISSSRRSRWVLPKGGWETDEPTEAIAAQREAWEEAGIIVQGLRDLGTVNDWRKDEETTPEAPKASYRFFEAVVIEEKAEWPEMAKRDRKWMSFEEANKVLTGRPELLEALKRCGMKKD